MFFQKKEVKHELEKMDQFGRLYDEYYQPIFGFMYNRTGNAEVAKDLTSETFFQALKNFHRYKPKEGIHIKSWLYAIAVAQVGTYFRKRTKIFELTLEEAPELLEKHELRPDEFYCLKEEEKEKNQHYRKVRQLMLRLNKKQQDIISLRFFSQMSIPEIAATLSLKEGTVKSDLHRALKFLQSQFFLNKESETQTEKIEKTVQSKISLYDQA